MLPISLGAHDGKIAFQAEGEFSCRENRWSGKSDRKQGRKEGRKVEKRGGAGRNREEEGKGGRKDGRKEGSRRRNARYIMDVAIDFFGSWSNYGVGGGESRVVARRHCDE